MDLYDAILTRRSVRRYQNVPLEKGVLAQLDEIIAGVVPLVPQNRFRVMRRDVVSGEDLIAAMGGYGRVLSPPHYLVASAMGDSHLLSDLGFRMEQIALRLVQIGVSTCFIGSLGRESHVRTRFRLLRDARTGAFLIFGYPAETLTGRTLNAAIRRAAGATNKLPLESLFYSSTFEHGVAPPRELAKLIEAGRLAPTANSAQPWRFLWHGGQLYLFLRRDNPRYGNKEQVKDYRFFDGGTCMANISMAMDALQIGGAWTLLHGVEPGIPAHPTDLQPLVLS